MLRTAKSTIVVFALGVLLAALVHSSVWAIEGPGTVTYRPVFLSAPAGTPIEQRQYYWITPCQGRDSATHQEALSYQRLRNKNIPGEPNFALHELSGNRTLKGEGGAFVRKGSLFWVVEEFHEMQYVSLC